jgi:hypothetical protein
MTQNSAAGCHFYRALFLKPTTQNCILHRQSRKSKQYLYLVSRNSPVGIVTKVRIWRPRCRGLKLCMDKKIIFFFSKISTLVIETIQRSTECVWDGFSQGVEQSESEANHTLWMSGVKTPYPSVSSRRPQEQFGVYCTYWVPQKIYMLYTITWKKIFTVKFKLNCLLSSH